MNEQGFQKYKYQIPSSLGYLGKVCFFLQTFHSYLKCIIFRHKSYSMVIEKFPIKFPILASLGFWHRAHGLHGFLHFSLSRLAVATLHRGFQIIDKIIPIIHSRLPFLYMLIRDV